MDQRSSPSSGSSTVSATASATKQPTYTTAGTLWNPSASQPLQPPTRRGRSFKWAVGGPHSDLALLPKSVLASLPLKTSLSRATSFQRYSPLQQNYDRAISPFGDRDHHLASMSPLTPRVRSGNAQTPLASVLSQLDKDSIREKLASESDEEADDDDDDDDSDFNMNPLLNMTVKSLNNLASYPNPNQRRAQKALYGRIKPTLTGQTSLTRGSAPTSPPMHPLNSPGYLRNGRGVVPTLPTAHSDSSLLRQSQTNQDIKPEIHSSTEAQADSSVENGRPPDLRSTSTTRTPGLGVPRPLTAGPPGQRQYRPSTFESTFKALQNKVDVKAQPTHSEDAITIARQTMYHAGINDTDLVTDAFPSPLGIYNASTSGSNKASTIEKMTNFVMDGKNGGSSGQGFEIEFALQRAHHFELDKIHSNVYGKSGAYSAGKPSFGFEPTDRFKPGTDRLSDAALMARNQRIEKYWYEGTDMLGKTTDEVLAEARLRHAAQKVGAIGDGRPHKPREQYRRIVIEDANRMSVAEHAKPLLNMAFATLVQNFGDDGLNRCQYIKRNAGVTG